MKASFSVPAAEQAYNLSLRAEIKEEKMDAWINGEFKSLDQAKVSLLSHSFGRGSSIFEVFDITSTPKGTAFFAIEPHIARLFNSAELIYMTLPMGKDEIIAACADTARHNNVKEGVTKMFAYFPNIELGVYPQNPEVHLAIFCIDYEAVNIKRESLCVPVNVGISKYRKLHPDTMPIHAKVCGSYVNGYLGMAEALRNGYQDFINCDLDGYVAESAAASAFFVENGTLKTAGTDSVLMGITRRVILELVQDVGIAVEETKIKKEELMSMEEAFFAVSSKRVQPIRSINGQKLGNACPGPVTQRIIDAIDSLYGGSHAKSEKWLTYI